MSGPEIRERVQPLVKSGEATLVKTAIVTSNTGQVVSKSIRKTLYPTDYRAPTPAKNGDATARASPGDLQISDVGLYIEATPESSFTFEWVTWDGERETTGRGKSEVESPVFYKIRSSDDLPLNNNEPILLASHRPGKRVEGVGPESILLAFMRLEIHEIVPPQAEESKPR